MSRLVITGTSVISAAGHGTSRLWEAMAEGATFFDSESVLWPTSAVDQSTISWPTGEVWLNNQKYANLAAHWAVAAARLAIDRAPDAESAKRCGIVMAVGTGGSELGDVIPHIATMAQTDPRPLPKLLYDEIPDYTYIRGIPSQIGQFVALAIGFAGSNIASYGETGVGGLGGLSLATRLLDSGELDRVIVVGVAPPSAVGTLVVFDREDPYGTEAKPGRGPFDVNRAGAFVGQAATAIAVERVENARARGAIPLAELTACEVVCAAKRQAACGTAVESVLGSAGRSPEIWWAHATGSVATDLEEHQATAARIPSIPTTSSKGTIGTAIECAALIDIALAVETLVRGQVPPVGLLRKPDPLMEGTEPVVDRPHSCYDAQSTLVTALGHGPMASTAGAALITRKENKWSRM